MNGRAGGSASRAPRSTGLVLLGAVVLALAGAIATGCGRSPELSHTLESPEALARAVLDRLAAGDRDGLLALALSEEEFRLAIWPALPAARPERNLPFSYVWKDLSQKSNASLSELIARFQGQRLEFVRLEFTGATTAYDGFEVSRGSRVWVRGPDGQERSLRAFGSMLRQGARYKVFSYVVD